MKQNIKQLVESLFDNDTIDNLTSSNLHSDIVDQYYKNLIPAQIDKRYSLDNYKFFCELPDGCFKIEKGSPYTLSKVVTKICGKFSKRHDIIPLNWIDTSEVESLYNLFYMNEMKDIMSKFHGTILIDKWNVSNVKSFSSLFYRAHYHFDVSNWDVSNGTNFSGMFHSSIFNGDVSNWDVSKNTDFSWMFYNTLFNGDVSNWNVWNAHDFHSMFNTNYRGDISKWKIDMKKVREDLQKIKQKYHSVNSSALDTLNDRIPLYIQKKAQLVE